MVWGRVLIGEVQETVEFPTSGSLVKLTFPTHVMPRGLVIRPVIWFGVRSRCSPVSVGQRILSCRSVDMSGTRKISLATQARQLALPPLPRGPSVLLPYSPVPQVTSPTRSFSVVSTYLVLLVSGRITIKVLRSLLSPGT